MNAWTNVLAAVSIDNERAAGRSYTGDDSSKIDIVPCRVPTVKVGCRRRFPDHELIQLAERVSTAPKCL